MDILHLEQKGLKKDGCKDQFIINKMIMKNCRSKQKNISMAWIDFKKAFDSVPNKGILKVLNI